jgi:hypothetical protein
MTPGMTGVGYSVIRGQAVEPFDVEILGVMPNYFYLGVDVIVAKMTGPPAFLNTTGGAVAGMSGSPVYINGRLAGAVAWAIAEDRQIFGLTAAEDMVGIFSLSGGEKGAMPETVALTPEIRRAIARATDTPLAATASEMGALPVPLGVSSTGGRPLTHVEATFADHGVAVSAFRSGTVAAPTAATLDPTPLLPGEGLGVALSYGDYSAYGFATATAVCGDSVLGFGHPMFWGQGTVALGMAEVNVLAIDNGTFWGSKIAILGDAHGMVTQDRFAGILGIAGVLPPTVPVTSSVSSPDTGLAREGRTDITWDEGWFVAEAAYGHAWANLTNVAQEDAPGTLAFTWTLTGTRADGGTWTVSNRMMEYSDYGAAYGAWRMSDMIYALVYNGFEKVTFTGVDMSGQITGENLTSEISRIRVSSPVQPSLKERDLVKAEPGDRIKVEVTLDPFERNTNVVATFSIKVPRRAQGTEQVKLAGGKGHIDYWGREIKSLDDLLAAMGGGDHPNDLIVRGFGWTGTFPQDVIVHGKGGFWVQIVR